MSPAVRDLLERFLRAARQTELPYAVGGALAMAAHGYARQTQDVDVFLAEGDVAAWSRALRAQGLNVNRVMGDIHYIATSPEYPPDARIDMLIPFDDPEWSAVQFPEHGSIAGVRADVFPITLLVAAKYQSDRDQDHADVRAMNELGLFEPLAVVKIFRQMGDDETAETFKREYAR